MKKNILGSFREKAGVTRKTAISAISAVLAVALIATVAFGFIPDTAIKASAESIGLISSASGKNYLPDTYTAVNVPAGTYTMTEDQYKTDSPQKSENGVAAFDFHIFAKNFASKAHTCGNIAVENLGAPTAGATGAPEFGSRPNHDTTSIKLSYVENIYDWSTSAQADAFVFGPNNTVTENAGQVLVETPSGNYMMGNGKELMDKTYIDDATPFIDIDAELTEAENYQRYLVWLMEDVREKAKNYYTPGWGYATKAANGETVRVLTHPDVAGWGWMGTTIDFSKYPEDTIIVDLDLYESVDWWTGRTTVGSNAQNLINGSVTLKGTAGKRIIFNVESSSGFNADNIKFADTNMKADSMGNSEDSVKLDNNILWNFYNRDNGVPKSTSGTITVGGTWMGSILAPNATVKCSAGLNGSIIAKDVTTSAETHKSDYTGEKVTKSDETSIKVTKIWQDDPATRPEFITVKLLQNNKAIKTVQLSASNCTVTENGYKWEYTFEKLPVTDGRGTSYRYDIEEVVPKGYTSNIVNNTIINTGKGETPKVGSLTFNKRPEGDSEKFLKDAEFRLTIDNGASLAGVTATGVSNFKATDGAVTWTSTDSAAVFSNLPYGNYTITETKAPAGYVTSNPVTVKVDGSAAKADMTDKQIEIKLAKLEGKNNEFLPGATMELTPNWGTSLADVKVEGVTTTSHDANKITWTSGKTAVTIKGIPAGSYTLTETEAPMGYDKAAPMTFIVEADGTVKVNSSAVSRVDMINNLTPAVIETYTINIGKKDGAGSSVDGAVLKLTSVNGSDLSKVTVDGQAPSLSDENKSITWTSGSAPAVFANLPVGSYTLTEVTAPSGYKLAGQMSITVSANGQSFDMIDEAIEMTISKQDSETYKELAGATLKLTSTSNKDLTGVAVIGAKEGTVNKNGTEITWVTDGNVVSFSKLPVGSYKLTETNKPAGYKTAAEITFEVDAEGKVTGTNINGNTCTMYDEPVALKIAKQYAVEDAETGEIIYGKLAGAALQLSSQNKNIDLSNVTGSIPVEHPDAYTITWASGTAANTLRGIPDGTYILHETEAPEGFVLAQDITIVVENGAVKSPTLNNNGEITMTDDKEQFHSMVFTKIDADEYVSNGDVKLVSGAKLGVFEKDAVSFASENAVLVFTSSNTPEKVMLPDGDYVLVELEAPEGYEKTNEKMYFTVNNGTLSVTSFDAAELASASYGKPSDDGLATDEDCYYTLETTGIFERYGYLPDKVHFTVDGTTQYYLNEFTLYKSDPSTTPPTETAVVTKSSNALATSWDAAIPTDAVYDSNCTYYAVLKLADSNNQQLTSNSTPKINLMFSYTGVSSEGASEQLTTSTTGTYTVGNCNGQVLEITKSNIDTYGYPEIVVSYNKDNAYANAYCNQSGLRLIINYTEDGNKRNAQKDIIPISGVGEEYKGKDVVFGQESIASAFETMKSGLSSTATIESYQIQMTTFAMQGAGNDSSSIPLDVTANYAGGAVGGGDVNVDVNIKDNFESKKEELSGSTNDTTDPIAVKIRESVGGETAYLVLPNYNTPPSYKNMCAVEITKVNESNKAITGSSASFLLYNENNELVGSLYGTNGVYAYNADKATANPANNADAPLVTDPTTGMVKITGLDQGKYYLVETDAPSSYEASEHETVFALTLSNIEKNPQNVTVKNTLKKGNITLIKTDDNGVLKEGATFDLYKVKLESINSTNPTGEYVGTYTTLNDGKYTVEVDLGYLYYAIEKTAPDGTANTNVTNETIFPQLATTGMDATRYVINGHNITYGVVLAEDIGTGNVKIQVATGLDDNKNIVYADKVIYEVDEDGKSTNVVKGMDVYEGSIGAENTAIDTTIAKIDETGAALAGATLKLEANGKAAGYVKSVFAEVTGTIAFEHRIEYVYTTNAKGETILSTDADDRPYIKSEYITWTSGNAANVLSGLPDGEYTLTELDAPEGYAVASPVTVTAGGSVTMTDKPLTGEITLKKNDALTNAVIAGVNFTLQVSDDGNSWTDTDKTCTTGADGTAKVTGLTYGKYYRFKETSTPAGYEANTGDAIYTDSVQITEDNLTSSVIRFENTAKTGKITLEKVEAGNASVKLENAVFELYYKASTANDSTYILYPGAATYTTNGNGQIVVDNLPWGYTYKFKEVGTPTGYVESDAETAPIALTATELEKTVTVENTKLVASLNLTGTKTITGKNGVSEQFDFAVMENGKDVVTVKNVGGNITFPAITYTYENVGDHTYTIYEKEYNANGITHDKSTYTLVVNVALTDGELVVTQKSLKKGDADATSIAFVNTYTASGIEATVEGTKTLNGKALTDGAFTFELIETGADFNTANKTAETTTNLGGTFSFTKNYTEAGTHYYVIKEQIPADTKGITYDTAEYRWTVVVEDNGTGNLVIKSKTLTKDGTAVESGKAAFTNTYTAAGTSATIEGVKTLNGKTLTDGAFTFELIETGADFNTADKTAETTTNLGGTFSFTKNYTEAGTHYYVIKEQIPAETKGITYDTAEYRWTVVVEDNGTGALVIKSKTLTKDGTAVADGKAVFTNTYTAAGTSATIEGVKTLNGKALTDGAFTFDLIETGADFNTTGKTAKTATNTNGAFSFTENYTEAGTHYYVIKEQIPAETKGITYDTAEYRWTVVVEDNGTGNMVVKSKTLTTKDGAAVEGGKAAFTNTYAAAGTNATIEGVKTLNGKTLTNGAFTFELIETGADFNTTGKTAKTTTNTGTAFSFTENYTEAGTHYYVIKEQIPADTKGITYDTAEYRWTVVVEDNGTGNLVVKSKTLTTKDGTAVENGKAAFTNTYTAAGTSATIEGVKTLNGKALTDGAFTFELIETGADFNTTGKTAKTATNTGTAFSFTENYTEAGTHYYVIKEQIPADTKGITYDTAEYRWTVVVEDNGTGNLVVKSKTLTTKDGTAVENGKAAFTNTYTAAGTSATIEGVKTLNGKALTDGAFTFELIETGADFNTADKTAETTTNTGTAFSFTENYTEAGTHYYVIKEQIPAETKGITYDTAEYRWTVVVEDNGTGALVIKSKTLTKDGAAVEGGKAAFTNTYAAASVTATINGTKTLDGKAPAAEAFTFELWSAKAEGGKYVADEKLKEFKNGADGKFTVETDALTAEGTYYFIVKEAIPEGAVRDVYNGITYDNSEYLWTVEVEDNGTGNLVASKAVDAEDQEMVLEFANTTARETVKFSKKVAGGGNELPGATIEIAPVGSITFDDSVTVSVENADKTATKITWVSGRDAVEISGLPVGIYTMTETAAPAGYAMAPEVIYFRIADDGTIYSVPASEYKEDGTTEWKAVTNDTVIMEDAPYTSVFSKKAADGGNELAGAKLSIKPIGTVNLGNVILPDDDVRIVNGAITWTSTTEPKTIGALPNGVYEFTETQAPQGYEIAETIYVKIDGDNVYSVIGDAYTGETTVWGDAAEDDKVIMVDNVNQAVFSKQAMTSEDELPGAILTLKLLNTDTTLNSVILPTGVTLLSDNRTLTWRSDDESKVIGKLPDGIYEFTEIEAPSGYEKADTIYVLIDGGDVYSVTKAVYNSAEGTVDWGTPVNDDKIVMKDDYNKAVFSKQATNAGGELPGAKLTLTPVVSTTDISKVKVPEGVDNKDGVISWTSGEEEVIIGWLPDGVYKFTEVTAPSGYEVAETIYVKIDNGGVHSVPESSYDGEDTVWSAAEDGDRVIMKDAPNSLVISKQAAGGGSELAGAKLTLTPVVSTTDIDKVVVPDGVTNKDGVIFWTSGKQPVTLNMVPDGVYKFTEVQAPDKYDIAETIYIKVENGEIFSVNESDYDGEDTIWGIAAADDKIIMIDALTPAPNEAKFEFTKYTDAGFTISGAVFKLTGSNGYSRAVTSGSAGKVTFDGMTEGTYTLVETAAPQKFIKSAAAVYITVDAEGKLTIKNEDGQEITVSDVEALMTNKVIPVEDEKKGKEGDVIDLYTELVKNNKEYEDITITWESSDDSVASVDANGKVTLKKPGTATITAKSGDTVLGTFVLGAEAKAPTTTDDVPYTGDTDTPQTGDYAVGWTIALSAILLASGATAKISYDVIKRRRNARAK